ncbi:zincin, partial [Backusella circina FSU 941]
SIGFDDHIRLTLRVYNQSLYLHLVPNLDIFHPKAVINQRESSQLNPQDFKVYRGYVFDPEKSQKRWEKEKLGIPQDKLSNSEAMGWARIVITGTSRHGGPIIEGAFQVHNEQFHVKTTKNYNKSKRWLDASVLIQNEDQMVIYKDSDILVKRENHSSLCGFDNLMSHRTQKYTPFFAQNKESDISTFGNPFHSNKDSLFKRSSVTQGCPKTKKINYMGVAADCTYAKHYGSANKARMQIINNFNMVSAIFEETFNVAIGLINITIMDSTCPSELDNSQPWNRGCDAGYPLSDRLSDFSLWRSQIPNDGAGLWHLMTNCPSGVEVGMAWLQQLCNSGSQIQISEEGKTQYVSGAGVSAITHDEWKIVAHEIGHGFGAVHDCTKDDCPCFGDNCNCCQLSQNKCNAGGSFIMNPASNSSAKSFSPCSVNAICSAFPSTGTCLSDPSEQKQEVFKLNTCGNGVLEEGEECDTGGQETACCDPKTCKLINDAICEDSNGSCCHKCQLLPKTHVCRPSASICDVEEYCTASSPFCPADTFIKDGTICGSNELKCASGHCTSRDAQCLSRGATLNVTRSCVTNNEECQVLCNSPGNTEKCLLISGFFINGTPCGFNGHCIDGTCKNGDAISSGVFWMEEHKIITIPGCILVLFSMSILLF